MVVAAYTAEVAVVVDALVAGAAAVARCCAVVAGGAGVVDVDYVVTLVVIVDVERQVPALVALSMPSGGEDE